MAGAAAVDPQLTAAPVILALVLFLWTPPHFWSLAFVYRQQYADAGVPMLPAVVPDKTAAVVVLAHTVALVVLSIVPYWFGMNWLYLLGAASGGAYFVYTSVEFVKHPIVKSAWRNFHASLAQLTLLLVAAILDAWLLG